MGNFLATLPDQYVHVVADNEHDAQLIAFAKFIRDLSPSAFTVRELVKADPWAPERES